ncbi:hypothetical protein ACJX0J_020153, partial [Zea mays]
MLITFIFQLTSAVNILALVNALTQFGYYGFCFLEDVAVWPSQNFFWLRGAHIESTKLVGLSSNNYNYGLYDRSVVNLRFNP